MTEFQFHVAMTLDREQTLEFIKIERLKVQEIGGKLCAMRPKKRKYAVSIDGKPVRLAL